MQSGLRRSAYSFSFGFKPCPHLLASTLAFDLSHGRTLPPVLRWQMYRVHTEVHSGRGRHKVPARHRHSIAMAPQRLTFVVLLIIYVLLSRRYDDTEVDTDALHRRRRRRVYEEVKRKKGILAAAYIISSSRHQPLPGVGRGHGARRCKCRPLHITWHDNLRTDLTHRNDVCLQCGPSQDITTDMMTSIGPMLIWVHGGLTWRIASTWRSSDSARTLSPCCTGE